MKETFKSTCSYCGVGCGVEVTRNRQGSLDLKGDEDSPVNRGMLCSKGMNLHHVVADQSDRLTVPKMRSARHHELKEVSWDAAMMRSAAVFRTLIDKYGPDSVGLYVSGQLLTEEYYLANKLTKGFLGTNNIDTNSRLCMSSAVVAYKNALGEDCVPISYDDIEASDCFFVAGANPAWCHPILFRRLEARLQSCPDAKLIVVDPRRTQTAEMADLHLQIQPGTDIELYNAIGAELLKNGAADLDFLFDKCNGAQDLLAKLKRTDVAAMAKICRITIGEIEEAARMIATSKTLLTFWAMGLNQSSVGVDKNLALLNLSLLTGRIGRPGCGPFSLTGQPNAMGGREVGGLSNMLAAHRDLANPQHIQEVADYWGVPELSNKPGLTATEMMDALESGKMKAIWIVCTNPAVSLPDLNRVEKALAKARFVMVSDISENSDTTAFADMVLPAAGWLEKEGTMTNSDRRVSYLPKVIEPPGKALSDSEIFIRFARAMGFDEAFNYADSEAVFREHCRLTKGTNIDVSGLSYQLLKEKSRQWPFPEGAQEGTPRLFEDHKFYTSDGKANVFAIEEKLNSEKLSAQYPFILTTGRVRDQWHTMTKTAKVGRLRQHINHSYAEIHPRDAEQLEIADGAMVKLTNDRGECTVRAVVTDTIKQGTLFMPMHFGRRFGGIASRANNLTSRIVDPKSKEPDFKFAAVACEKVSTAKRRIIVVGAGAAALEFIHSYRKLNDRDEICVFGREPHLFYNRVLLPEYINNEKDWSNLVVSEKQDLAKLKVNFHRGISVQSIDRDAQTIVDDKGETHAYDRLILATGSRPNITMDVPPNTQGIYGLRTRRDADAIKEYLKAGNHAVIVGGGLLGLELAGSLASLNIRVTIIQRSSRLMRGQLDPLGSELLHEEMTDRGIEVIYNDELQSFHTNDNQLKSIRLKSGHYLDCEGLFFAAGIKPNSELGIAAGLKANRGLQVNDQLQTSDANIYAMGEIAEHQGRLYGTTPAAQDQARIVAASLAGDPTAIYTGSLDFNILKIKGLELCSLGQPRLQAGLEEIFIVDKAQRYYKKCLLEGDRLVGAILIGDKSEFGEFKDLIENGLELGEKRAELLKSFSEAEPAIGAMVCSCRNVGEGNLQNLIKQGCTDFDELCSRSGAGGGCGSCRPEVKRILTNATAITKEECSI